MTQLDPTDALGDEALSKQLLALKMQGNAPHPLSPAGKRLHDANERHQARQNGANKDKLAKIIKSQYTPSPRSKQASAVDQLIGYTPAPPGASAGSDLNDVTRAAALGLGSRAFTAQQQLIDQDPMNDTAGIRDQKMASYDPRQSFDEGLAKSRAGTQRTLAALMAFERSRQFAKDPLAAEALRKATKKCAKKGIPLTQDAFDKARAKLARPSVPKAPPLTAVDMKGPTSAAGMAGTSGLAGAVERPSFPAGRVAKGSSSDPEQQRLVLDVITTR